MASRLGAMEEQIIGMVAMEEQIVEQKSIIEDLRALIAQLTQAASSPSATRVRFGE